MEEDHGHVVERVLACCGAVAYQSLLWVEEEPRGASSEGVAPSASSVGAWGACWGEEVWSSRGEEGNAACAELGKQEDVGVGLYLAVPQANQQGWTGCFLEELLGA